ncbi:MAG: thioredoxin-disulfide reductase [archaeon GBS-70-058]|nr:thioredoxin-disulfide reductase [Candidatus Culexarchaeum nevadense]
MQKIILIPKLSGKIEEQYDVIIIGAGIAGSTAAIYTARQALKTLLIDKVGIGGNLLITHNIENYPGYPSISGLELAEKLEIQLKKLNVPIVFEEVKDVNLTEDNLFQVKTTLEKTYKARALIVATGAEHAKLGIPGEKEFLGRGISYCATCDGPLFKGRNVAVIGGGNTAATYVEYLSNICKKVYWIHRRREFRAEPHLQKIALSKMNVEKLTPYKPIRFEGVEKLEKIILENLENGEQTTLNVEGVFIAIGQKPNTEFLKNLPIKLKENGYIEVDERMRTNVKGVCAAGDVNGIENQYIVAAGQGATAALTIARYLKTGEWQ